MVTLMSGVGKVLYRIAKGTRVLRVRYSTELFGRENLGHLFMRITTAFTKEYIYITFRYGLEKDNRHLSRCTGFYHSDLLGT